MQGFSDAILQMTTAGHPADDVTKYQIFNSFRFAFDEFSEKIKTCSASKSRYFLSFHFLFFPFLGGHIDFVNAW